MFVDKATGKEFVFLTNLPVDVPPGVVALLYRMRWDVEKVFDELMNKLGEAKAWASTAVAKEVQAKMLCLTHNLLLLLEDEVEKDGGVANEKEIRRRLSRIGSQGARARRRGKRAADNGIRNCLEKIDGRLTHHSVRFIRWVNNHLDSQALWGALMARLRAAYAM